MRKLSDNGRRLRTLVTISLACITVCRVVNAATMARKGSARDKVVEYAISPNGTELAEMRVASSGVQSIVLVELRRGGAQPRTLFRGASIGQIVWASNRSLLFVIPGPASVIVRQDVVSGRREVLFKSDHEISIAAYDRQRGLLAYEYSVPWAWRGRVSVRVKPSMNTLELLAPTWARWPGRVKIDAIHLVASADRPHVRKIPLVMRNFRLAPNLAWRGGRLLGLVSTLHSWRTRLFDLESGRRLARNSRLYRMSGLTVSRRDQMVVVANRRYHAKEGRVPCGCNGSLNLFRLRSHRSAQPVKAISKGTFVEAVSKIWWTPQGNLLAQVMGYRRPGGAPRWFLEEVNPVRDTVVHRWYWPHGDLGGNMHVCEFNADREIAVCEVQTLRDPPSLVRLDVMSGTMRVLGAVNPTQRRLKFKFLNVRVPNRFGHWSTGFLAIPPHSPNQAIPLAVMSYDFTEAYSRDAQWITSYPVARFVHAGIAVLLMNWAGIGTTRRGRFEESRRALESAVSQYRNAISTVAGEGVRISRAMVMGWSFGGLFAAHAIQTLPTYVAAQIGDPAQYNVTAFGLGGEYWRNQSDIFFGGPPTGRYLSRYQYLDPVGDGRPAMGPILLEFVSRNPDAGQLLEEWRAAGTEVEAFAYRRSVHWLNVPAEAQISRLRNLYWAKLNLFGPDAVTKSQLRRVGLTIPQHSWWNARATADAAVKSSRASAVNATTEPRPLLP